MPFDDRFDPAGEQIHHRHLRLAVAPGRAQTEPHQEFLADGHARDRTAFRIEELAEDLDALADLRCRRVAIEARFVDGVVRQAGPGLGELQFCGGLGNADLGHRTGWQRQRLFTSVLADLRDAETVRAWCGLGVGVEREQGVGGRQRAHAVAADGGAHRFKGRRRRVVEARGEMAREQVEQLRVVDDAIVVDLLAGIALLRRPRHALDDPLRVVVPLHQPVGRRQIRRREIGRPGLGIAPRQLLLDVRQRGVRLDALPHQQVDGIRPQPSIGQRAGGRRRKAREPVVHR